jgi:hypothetical protein
LTDETLPSGPEPVGPTYDPTEAVEIIVEAQVIPETPTEESSETEPSDDTPPAEVKEVETKLRVFFQQVSLDSLMLSMTKRLEILGKEEYDARVETPGSYENILQLAFDDYSVEAQRILDSISRIDDKSLFDNKFLRDGKVFLSALRKPRRPHGGGKMLTGKEARVEFAIKAGEVKRVQLYNSGFYVDIEAATLDALNLFFTRAHDATNAYGREFGANFFYYNDLLIKESMIELITPLFLGSSLKHWNRGNTLLKHIKLNDLKVILTALASLMFPDGFEFTHYCTNPTGECTHHEDMLIDITKLIRHNYMKLSSDNIEHMASGTDLNQEQVAAYQESLGFSKKIRHGIYEFELRVPSIADYLEYGKQFNGELLKSNFADNTVDVYQSLAYSYYKVYTPFIKSATIYAADGTKDNTTEDQETITWCLSRLQKSDLERKFVEDMTAYIASTEITHICYPAIPCPKCGHAPEGGYFTVDPESSFFTQSLKKLTQG